MKKILYTLILSILVLGCAQEPIEDEEIVTTFFALESLTTPIAQGVVNVTSIIPPNADPHAYEPSPQDAQRIEGALGAVTLKLGFEGLEEELFSNIPSERVILASEGLRLVSLEEEADHEDEHAGEQGVDPHVWLSPKNALVMAANIEAGLVRLIPAHEESLRANARAFEESLESLDEEFSQGLSSCEHDTIIVGHNAYSYLARDYNFTTVSVAGISPEAEPTPRQLQALVETAREHGLGHVFFDEAASPQVAETIAREVGAHTLALNPIEAGPESYEAQMRENLYNLRLALGCT